MTGAGTAGRAPEMRFAGKRFAGKRALVTGGATGIGLATVKALLAEGARVAINFLPDCTVGPALVTDLRAEGFDALPAPGDVADPEGAAAMVRAAAEALGGLDILVNNAGTPVTRTPIPLGDLDAIGEEFWDAILSTNLVGPFRCVRAALPYLKESRGCVVNTASIAGLGGGASSIAYAASKAGLVNMTLNLAKGLAPHVRVNAVAPGLTRTPWTATWTEERKQRSLAATALARMVEPDEVADAMLFLCGNGAITGQTIVVDCGRF